MKLIYWIPIIGVFASLVNYDKENDMSIYWSYYQAVMILAFIWIISYFTFQ
jgi:hypothetical protein